MESFVSIHQKDIWGVVSTFDRLIFKGYLTSLYPAGALARFLFKLGILLKNFGPYVQSVTAMLQKHAQAMAEKAGRPYLYSPSPKPLGQSKEDWARDIARQDHITQGLICVLAVLEPCQSFEVRGNRVTQQLEVKRSRRKCLHFYFYFMDPEFGFMHVRLQSWFPFEIQVYINGHEWLARELDKRGIGYERLDNTFTRIDDLKTAEKLCVKFAHRQWPRVLDAMARQVNPYLGRVKQAGFGGYYWVLDQVEYATDIIHRTPAACFVTAPLCWRSYPPCFRSPSPALAPPTCYVSWGAS